MTNNRAALDMLIAGLKDIGPVSFPLDCTADDFNEAAIVLGQYTKAFDGFLFELGMLIRDNARCNIDMKSFTGTTRDAVSDQFYEIERAAEAANQPEVEER